MTTSGGGGVSAGSSSSSGGGVAGLVLALALIFLLQWYGLPIASERCRRTVFLALPERPG
jgi:hypothetical protein